jgi:hypothetical protein
MEPLGSHCLPPRGDQMCQSDRPDVANLVSSHGILTTCHCLQMWAADLQWSSDSAPTVKSRSDTWQHDLMHPHGVRSHARLSQQARDLMHWHPDRTRHQRGVRSLPVSSPSAFVATWRVRSTVTRPRPAFDPSFLFSVHASVYVTSNRMHHHHVQSTPSASVQSKTEATLFTATNDRTLPSESGHIETKVRSVKNNTSSTPTSPPLIKCANHQVYHLMHVC